MLGLVTDKRDIMRYIRLLDNIGRVFARFFLKIGECGALGCDCEGAPSKCLGRGWI